jgi:outer membrane protein
MKKLLQSLLILGAFGQVALFAQAQPAQKILFVDMAKLYDGHYRAIEARAKLQADGQKAQAELDRLSKEINALVQQFKELDEQSNNPTATAEAKTKSQAAAQAKYQEIRSKQADATKFQENVGRELQQRNKEVQGMIMEDIAKLAADVAKKDGATVLIDKSGPTMFGFPAVIYSDPSFDITAEVAAEIAKTKPVATPATTPTTPAPTPAPPADTSAPADVTAPVAPKS